MESWIDDIVFITEYCMALNHKSWQWYEDGNEDVSKLYCDLYYDCRDRIDEHYDGNEEALSYFYQTTD